MTKGLRTGFVPVTAVLAAAVVAGCSSSGSKAAVTTTTATTALSSTTSVASSTTTSVGSSTSEAPGATTSLPASNKFYEIFGQYVGSTEDSGSLYIRPDGASRFLAPDDKSCPTCATAASPKASIDFSLRTLSNNGTGTYSASGVISDTSDVPWAASLSARATIGSSVTVTIDPTGAAHVSFLPANDGLMRYGMDVLHANTPPCTVAAASGPVAASEKGAKVNGVTCAPDQQWMEASVSQNGIDEVKVLQADYSDWLVVDRPTVCNNHDVPANFFKVACSTS